MRDCKGTELDVGQVVAVNVSGDVGLGRIVRLKPSASYYTAQVEVELLTPAGGKDRGHVSKVKRPTSVCVVDALRFYADPESWEEQPNMVPRRPAADLDRGHKARVALGYVGP
jgi:hypothetical protein